MFTMWRVCAIVLCLVGVHRAPLAVVGANTQAEDPQDPAGCAPPLEFLVQHNVAAQEHLAQLPSNGKCGGRSVASRPTSVSARRVGRVRVSRGALNSCRAFIRGRISRVALADLGVICNVLNIAKGEGKMCRLPYRNGREIRWREVAACLAWGQGGGAPALPPLLWEGEGVLGEPSKQC